jgi:polyvinyl alcohol dehydrogenase (cytochrome)
MVYALDARSGCVHWSFEAKRPVLTAVSIGSQRGSRGRYAAYFGDHGGNVYALDAETGKELWQKHVDEHPGAIITGSVTLDRSSNRLLVPVSSWEEVSGESLSYECCTFRGSVLALEAGTGRQIWKTYTMEKPRPLWENKLGKIQYGPAGSAVWVTPTLDLKRRALYFGTSNAYNTEPDKGTSDAFFAFNLDTGGLRWRYQATANDVDLNGCGKTKEDRDKYCPGKLKGPNDDVPAAPIIHTLANGRQLIIGVQESRRITVMDPDNGQVIWQKIPSDRPTATTGNLGPGDDGELLYVPLAFQRKPLSEENVQRDGESGNKVDGEGGIKLDGEGGITAIRPETGELVWTTILPKPTNCPAPESRWCSSGNQGAVTVIPGVVFTGSVDGTLRAFSTRDGNVLWSFATNRAFTTTNGIEGHGGTIGGPGPTVVGGMVYAGSGYTIVGSMPGNVLLAFGVE